MQRFGNVFKQTKCNVIGMIHLGALPGTPMYKGNVSKILDAACREAELYDTCCVDGVLIENMHDVPYVQPKNMEPETVAVMASICFEIRKIVSSTKPCGVQVLAGGNKEAIAVALAANLQFVRVEGFVFSHIADEGFIDASAGNLLRYRSKIGAENVLVLADVKKKHSSHSITADISLVETIQAAEFFLSDGIILTGTSTGDPVNIDHLSEAKQISTGPVLIGSGVSISNVQNYIHSDGLIIGSHFKENGSWKNKVDKSRVLSFMEKINNIRLCGN